jgi:hypothetical protein
MGLEVLVPLLMGALLKIVGKAGEGVVDAVGDAAKETATGLFGKIRAWWSGDTSASDDLAKFEQEPDVYQPVVEARLIKKLTAEPHMQAELAALVEEAGPQAEVFQKIASAHGVTGAQVAELSRGRLHVVQEIENATDVTGVEIERMD